MIYGDELYLICLTQSSERINGEDSKQTIKTSF